jgi:hypothetical protein
MAKGKAAAPVKGQKSITSFFGGGKKEAKPETDDEDMADVEHVDSVENAADVDSSDNDAPATKKKTKSTPPDTSDLCPIYAVPAMFADLVGRIPQIKDVAEHIKGRKLRVATMCSGTESPLLALGLICEAINEQYGVPLDVEHVFSCEIEPFKQAYIERNFQPPLLFRDVCELGETHAYVPLILLLLYYGAHKTPQNYCLWRTCPCSRRRRPFGRRNFLR